jgi:hypothetical protein
MLLLLPSCRKPSAQKGDIDWSVSLDHNKKTPYGTSIVFETLPHYFPAARREQLSRGFRYTSIDEHMYGGYDSAALLVLLGLDCYITDEEWMSLLKFAKAGNEVLLLSSNLDAHLSTGLHLKKGRTVRETVPLNQYNNGGSSVDALQLLPDSNGKYGYRGRTVDASFQPNDSTVAKNEGDESAITRTKDFEQRTLEASIDTQPEILGLAHGEPDFLRYRVGGGHITLHAAPLIFSNYFLLQQRNRFYLDSVWHSFPANISAVYWNEYFRRSSTQSSNLSVLMRYPATRWALIIAIFTLLLYVLLGLKRMQRIVPVIPQVANASVSFVETVGRLYFNKGNHTNLAEKMVQHFLEWVRSYYYLDTSQLGEPFIRQLAAKSGKSIEEAEALVQRIHEIRLGIAVTPEYLYGLHRSIQSFYNAH